MTSAPRHFGRSIALILGVLVFVAYGFLARGEVVGDTFATGSGRHGLELKVDSTTYYNGEYQPKLSWELKNLKPWKDHFFWFKDVKPGDTGTNTISIHIKKNAAYVCLDFQRLRDRENGRNEPERLADDDRKGELSEELEFFAWRDDGDNRFEVGEEPLFGTSSQAAQDVLKGQSYALADKHTGSPIEPYQTAYVGITWCAGDLSVDTSTATITCDAAAMGNEAQTDSMKLDVSLRAVVAKQQPWFSCTKPKPHCDKHTKRGKHGCGHGHGDDNDDNHDDDEDQDDNHHDDDENEDDNHHDDDDHTEWTHGGNTYHAWERTKRYCVNAWRKVTRRS